MIYANKKKKKKKKKEDTDCAETKVGRQFHVVNAYNMKILYS